MCATVTFRVLELPHNVARIHGAAPASRRARLVSLSLKAPFLRCGWPPCQQASHVPHRVCCECSSSLSSPRLVVHTRTAPLPIQGRVVRSVLLCCSVCWSVCSVCPFLVRLPVWRVALLLTIPRSHVVRRRTPHDVGWGSRDREEEDTSSHHVQSSPSTVLLLSTTPGTRNGSAPISSNPSSLDWTRMGIHTFVPTILLVRNRSGRTRNPIRWAILLLARNRSGRTTTVSSSLQKLVLTAVDTMSAWSRS